MEKKGLTEVFLANFKEEEKRLLWAVESEYYDSISIDTEFPGFIVNPPPRNAVEDEVYRIMKSNVERTKLILVGFTIFNSTTGEVAGVWQFNLSGFDPTHHNHTRSALEMLKKSGVDFRKNYYKGVKMWQFVELLNTMINIRHQFHDRDKWVTFHGLYDVGYLLAAVRGKWNLPEDIRGFSQAAGELFSGGIFDVKCMAGESMKWMGLEKIAAALGESREEGCPHQAGSDSLLIARAFVKAALQCSNVEDYRRRLFGISQPIMSMEHHYRRILLHQRPEIYSYVDMVEEPILLPPRSGETEGVCFSDGTRHGNFGDGDLRSMLCTAICKLKL